MRGRYERGKLKGRAGSWEAGVLGVAPSPNRVSGTKNEAGLGSRDRVHVAPPCES